MPFFFSICNKSRILEVMENEKQNVASMMMSRSSMKNGISQSPVALGVTGSRFKRDHDVIQRVEGLQSA